MSETEGASDSKGSDRSGSATDRASDNGAVAEAGARTSEAMTGASVRGAMTEQTVGALQGAADTLDPNDDPDTVDRAMNGLDSFNGTPESRAAAANAEAAAQAKTTPPEDPVMQRMREDVAIQLGQAQGREAAAGGWISGMAGGVAEAVETGYEMAVAGIEDVTGLIDDDYAARQRADLQARADGLAAAAQEAIDNPEALARALVVSYETRFAAADALERAYRDGYADLSVLQESARMRAEAEAELAILGVETAGTVIGAGAIAKGLRALDVAEDLADSNLGTLIATRTARDGATVSVAEELITNPAHPSPLSAADISARVDEKISWVDERASMNAAARAYDDGAPGSRSNIETQASQAPTLQRTLPTGEQRAVRFDGVDGDVMIDRKRAVVTTPKAKNQALRQSEALAQNGLTARWEVPNQAQADRAHRIFRELDITNITVEVNPE